MKFQHSSRIPVPAQFAFDWHARPGALARLLPHWEDVRVHSSTGGIEHGDRVEMSVPLGPLRKRWIAEHRDCVPGEQFTDVQLKGPFASWEHRHRFERVDEHACYLHDEIHYQLPFGPVGQAFGAGIAKQKLANMFEFRHQRTIADLTDHYAYRERPRLRILISGSTGLVGSALVPYLTTGGHEVFRLVRDEKHAELNPHAIYWNIKEGEIDRSQLEGFDAVIHLAGASIAGQRWTASYKEKIRDSRVRSTQLLAGLLATLQQKPKVLISTSATGFYGDRGDEVLDETSASGLGFLPEVARAWEEATAAAEAAGIRVVHPRLGIVLSPRGGALKEMLTPFRWGGGGIVGTGRQYWSSISLDDVVRAFHFLMMEEAASGPVNVVMPTAPTNREFTKTLGQVLGRPTILPLPTFAVKALFGEMGETLLLESTRVVPKRLQELGFRFLHRDLRTALRFALGHFSPQDREHNPNVAPAPGASAVQTETSVPTSPQ